MPRLQSFVPDALQAAQVEGDMYLGNEVSNLPTVPRFKRPSVPGYIFKSETGHEIKISLELFPIVDGYSIANNYLGTLIVHRSKDKAQMKFPKKIEDMSQLHLATLRTGACVRHGNEILAAVRDSWRETEDASVVVSVAEKFKHVRDWDMYVAGMVIAFKRGMI